MPPSARWLIICLTPDVCVTKGVPVPYIIVSEADLADCESPNVSYNGRLSMNAGSLTKACRGNEAGDTGAKSGAPVVNICTPIDKSETVRINGLGGLSEGDKFEMNLCNTIGKVVVMPAVSSPSAPGALSGADFDRAVADLIAGALKQSGGDLEAAYGWLTNIRNVPGADSPMTPPDAGNNPVVVAAQHFLITAKESGPRGIRIMEFLKSGYDALKQSPVFPPVDWALKQTGAYGNVNVHNLPSEYDPQVNRWEQLGLKVAGSRKRGIAYTPSAAELKKAKEDRDAAEREKGRRDAAPYIANQAMKSHGFGF